MNINKLTELNKILVSINEAKEANLTIFPYGEYIDRFNLGLKELLKEVFGDDIEFDRQNTFTTIKATYKGVDISINTFNGIALAIEDEEMGYLANDFKGIFTNIIGIEPICSYNKCFNNIDNKKVSYPTIEWSLNPESRLSNIVTSPGYSFGTSIENLEDFYTCSIIERLGTDLFTLEGYNELFETGYDNPRFVFHKIKQIQKLNPNVDLGPIYAWIAEAKEKCYPTSTIHAFRKNLMIIKE